MVEENHVINKPIFAIFLKWLQSLLSFKLAPQSEQFYSNLPEIRYIFSRLPAQEFFLFSKKFIAIILLLMSSGVGVFTILLIYYQIN